MAWALQDAKARFSEVVKRAQSEGPQEVTVRGEPTAYIVSKQDFEAMRQERRTGRSNVVDLLLEGEPWPDDFVDLVNQRSQLPARDVDL
ncbi:MAG: type II toxin-antitoxin system Phd/YefM family antitoxin [Bosea sp. (in: a-proteobacteria)]